MSVCSIDHLDNGVLVRITSPRNAANLRMTAALALFFGILGAAMVMEGIRHPPVSPGIIFVAFLFGIPLFGLLWSVGGKQTICVDGDRLTLRWSFPGIAYWRHDDAALISRLRPVKDANFALAFDVGGCTVMAAQGASAYDALRIVSRIGDFQSSFLDDTRS